VRTFLETLRLALTALGYEVEVGDFSISIRGVHFYVQRRRGVYLLLGRGYRMEEAGRAIARVLEHLALAEQRRREAEEQERKRAMEAREADLLEQLKKELGNVVEIEKVCDRYRLLYWASDFETLKDVATKFVGQLSSEWDELIKLGNHRTNVSFDPEGGFSLN